LTVALTTTPPEESVTVPVISPDVPTPCACAIRVASRKHPRTHVINFPMENLVEKTDVRMQEWTPQ
jgi:hypothetical protein